MEISGLVGLGDDLLVGEAMAMLPPIFETQPWFCQLQITASNKASSTHGREERKTRKKREREVWEERQRPMWPKVPWKKDMSL